MKIKYIDGIKKQGFIKSVFMDIERKSMNPYLKYIIFRCTDELISHSVNFPSVHKHFIPCEDSILLRVLHGCLSKDVLKFLNADDEQGAKEKLSLQTTDSLLSTITQQYETNIHNAKQKMLYLKSSILPEKKKNEKIKETETIISDLESRLSDIVSRMKQESCPICYEICKNPVTLSCCHNSFCSNCITKQFENNIFRCSFCREEITIQNIYSNPSNNSKIKNFKKLISPEKKFLIFTSYDSKLIQETFSAKLLSGNHRQIQKMIHEFNKGNLQMLILNPFHYGNGLNLECTTDIIFYHEVTKDIEEQVIGRVCRSGVSKQINVHYLQYQNEVS